MTKRFWKKLEKTQKQEDIRRLKIVKMATLAKLVYIVNTILLNIPTDFFA